MTNLTRHDVLAGFYDNVSMDEIDQNGLRNSLQEYLDQQGIAEQFNATVLLTFL